MSAKFRSIAKSPMPYRHIEPGIKEAAMKTYKRGLLPLEDILDVLTISRRTFYRIQRLYNETGHITKPKNPMQCRPRTLIRDDLDYLVRLTYHRSDWFLDELLQLLKTNRFISVHFTTIFQALERAGVSRKKLHVIAKERNEILHADFVAHMAQYEPEQLGFLDETSKDEHTIRQRYGQSARGGRATKRGAFI